MKNIFATRSINIPEGVTATCKSRYVTISGPRGELSKSFKHAKVDMKMIGARRIKVDQWHSRTKNNAVLRTITSHIQNMILGVTKGFRYVMKAVYAHFPINVIATDNTLEIRNFLGERIVRRVEMLKDVTITKVEGNQITLEGNDIELVSRSAALVYQKCLVKNKDIRKFLDGIYVAEKGPIPDPED